MKIKISNIEWDTSDGYDGSDLPCHEDMDLTEAINELLAETIGELVGEILSYQYGYPVTGFEIEVADEE